MSGIPVWFHLHAGGGGWFFPIDIRDSSDLCRGARRQNIAIQNAFHVLQNILIESRTECLISGWVSSSHCGLKGRVLHFLSGFLKLDCCRSGSHGAIITWNKEAVTIFHNHRTRPLWRPAQAIQHAALHCLNSICVTSPHSPQLMLATLESKTPTVAFLMYFHSIKSFPLCSQAHSGGQKSEYICVSSYNNSEQPGVGSMQFRATPTCRVFTIKHYQNTSVKRLDSTQSCSQLPAASKLINRKLSFHLNVPSFKWYQRIFLS